MPTLIDDLDFKNLENYSSRSLVAWLKRKTGSQEKKELIEKTLDIRAKNSLAKLNDRIQINYRLPENTSNKLKQVCKKMPVSKTYKYLDKSIFETDSIEESIKPTDLVKAIVESNIEKLWREKNGKPN